MLLIYAAVLVVYVMNQKSSLLMEFSDYEQLVVRETALVNAELTLSDTSSALLDIIENSEQEPDTASLSKHFERLHKSVVDLSKLFPGRADFFNGFSQILSKVQHGISINNLRQLKKQLTDNQKGLENLIQITRKRRDQAVSDYYKHSDYVAFVALVAGLAGLALFGGVTTIFFRRIARHIQELRKRIVQIMDGYRGAPLVIHRTDELGQLINGVNSMAAELEERERELELAHCKNCYQEKMISIENLAAGLVHEIGNPAAAIIGLCQELLAECRCNDQSHVEQIKVYGERLGYLGEDLAKLAVPQQKDYGLLNINELVQSACSRARFDERWQSVSLTMNIAEDLPAIYGYGDQILLVFVHLLANAFEGLTHTGTNDGSILVSTSRVGERKVKINIKDNGRGMDELTCSRSFEPFFTTKSEGYGIGLGLSLCQNIVTAHGGSIDIFSELGKGTKVSVILPLNSE